MALLRKLARFVVRVRVRIDVVAVRVSGQG